MQYHLKNDILLNIQNYNQAKEIMKTNEKTINGILSHRDGKLFIDNNQRTYKWKESDIKKVFETLTGNENPYFGAIVTQTKYCNDLSIIDGQQRLVTFSLIYLAMRNVILNEDEFKKDDELKSLADEVYEEYLIQKYYKQTLYFKTKARLCLKEEDANCYESLLFNNHSINDENNICKAYSFIYKYIKKQHSKKFILEIFERIKKVQIIHFFLETCDNAYQIFESINSTGKALTPGEIIKNKLFWEIEKIGIKEEVDNLTELILKIEENSLGNIDDCLRYWYYVKKQEYLTTGTKSSIIKGKICKFIEKIGVKVAVNSLYEFSKIFRGVLTLTYNSKKINNFLKTSLTDLYYFKILIFDVLTSEELTEAEQLAILKLGEKIVFRKHICGHTFLYKTFIGVTKKCVKEENKLKKFIQIINEKPLNLWGKQKIESPIPYDEEFIPKFLEKEIYGGDKEMTRYIFNKLENEMYGTLSKEYNDIYNNLKERKLTIEHIIPQTPTEEWKNVLGDNCQEIYGKYLNTIGNLTITGYNSEMSNKPFKDKKLTYEQSPFNLNKQLCTYENFGYEEFMNRQKFLGEKAKEIWKI